MDFFNEIAARYGGLFELLGFIVGVIGFGFGIWRFLRERKAIQDLEQSRRDLEEARSRLNELDKFADGLKIYRDAL